MTIELVAGTEGAPPGLIPLQSGGMATVAAPLLPVTHASAGFYARHGKRLLDIVLASVALLLLFIPMTVIAISLRISLGKGVFFRQARVGLDNKNFVVLKYRTMLHDRRARAVGVLPDGLPDRRITHKTAHDPRHTKVGRILRATSLDELPQFINVLKGDMSMVGPRPELVHLVDRMTPDQRKRHAVRPGITGPWQIGARHLALHEAVSFDLEYIRRLSLRNDLALLVRTPLALLKHTGS